MPDETRLRTEFKGSSKIILTKSSEKQSQEPKDRREREFERQNRELLSKLQHATKRAPSYTGNEDRPLQT
jgi:hypothetical protein